MTANSLKTAQAPSSKSTGLPNGIALGHYRLLHKQGHADAQNNIGWCYQNGLGVAKDVHEAVKWYRKAAKQGNARSQKKLKQLGKSW